MSKPNDKAKAPENKETEENSVQNEGYSCSYCCERFAACIVWTCKCLYNCIVCICNGIRYYCSLWYYPIKERCGVCCDRCDKSMNPYKDPYMNPYDTL